MKTLHKAKYIYSNGRIIENGGIFVNNGKITDCPDDYEIIDHGNAIITPGFINSHTHLQYTDLNPYRGNGGFSDWILDLIKQYFFWSKNKKLKSLRHGLNETVKSGVTCVVNLGIEEEFIKVLNNSGIKSYCFLETFADTEKRAKKEFKQLTKKLEKYNNFNIGISPHSPYNVHPALWEKLVQLDILIHTHFAESQDEMKWMNGEKTGINKMHKFVMFKTLKPYNVFEYLDKFGDNLILAHCNQLNFEDVRQYKIAHCPRSNMILHGKTLDLNGNTSNVGLGTDSKFSNEDLNILHEAKFLRDRSSLSFIEIMNMLTINAAGMLKMDNTIGTLEPGRDADFLVFKLDENQNYEDILNRDCPDSMYVKGKKYR